LDGQSICVVNHSTKYEHQVLVINTQVQTEFLELHVIPCRSHTVRSLPFACMLHNFHTYAMISCDQLPDAEHPTVTYNASVCFDEKALHKIYCQHYSRLQVRFSTSINQSIKIFNVHSKNDGQPA